MKRIVEQVQNGSCLVSDGAWGTLLQRKGLIPGECPELWCLKRRDDVFAIPRDYVAAGADLVKTNSFGANKFKLEFFGLEKKVRELNVASAAISREAAGPDRHVIASVGSTGKILLMGEVSEEEVYAAFREQLLALEEGGADACCIETMMAIDEACLAVRAAREATRLEVICTFTFSAVASGGYRTMMGHTPADVAQALKDAGAHLVGANCGQGPTQMVDILREMKTVVGTMPLVVHANAGLPHTMNGADVFPETPEMMASAVPALRAAGAQVIGGCCGTTPAHIAAMAAVIRGRAK